MWSCLSDHGPPPPPPPPPIFCIHHNELLPLAFCCSAVAPLWHKHYHHTGQTPQRREFTYPRNLTKTEDHEELRSRFLDSYVPRPDPFPLELTPLNPDEETAAASDSMTSIGGKVSHPGSTNSSLQVCEIRLFCWCVPVSHKCTQFDFFFFIFMLLQFSFCWFDSWNHLWLVFDLFYL